MRKPTFYWWLCGVRGLYTHVQLFKHMRRVMLASGRPLQAGALQQLRRQEAMIGHCLLKVLCVYPNADDGFGPPGETK